jgi:hypothetical protein
MIITTIRRAKGHLLRWLPGVAAVVRAVWPDDAKAPGRPGLARGRLTDAFFEPLPADELAAWQQ